MAPVTEEPTTLAPARRRSLRERVAGRETEHEVLADSLLDGRLRLDDEDRLVAFGTASASDPMFATFGSGLGRAAVLLILLIPVSMIKWHDHHWVEGLVQVAGGLVLCALYLHTNFTRSYRRPDQPPSWWLLGGMYVLVAGLVAIGDWGWVAGLILASSAVGYWRADRRGLTVILAGGVAVAVYAVAGDAGLPGTAGLVVEAVIPGLMARLGARRHDTAMALLRARQELARTAVTGERLRIARDLHDLLGHSLSVIALKAELAERLVATDPARAEAELADVQAVARRSLEEVRQAVEGYRRADLQTELGDAVDVLGSAGIRATVDAEDVGSLPAAVDAVLGWAVRESCTNVIRHSGASAAWFCVRSDRVAAEVQVDDDGHGCSGTGGGNGLAGLRERAARLGGTVETGPSDQGGFRVRVRVPLEER